MRHSLLTISIFIFCLTFGAADLRAQDDAVADVINASVNASAKAAAKSEAKPMDIPAVIPVAVPLDAEYRIGPENSLQIDVYYGKGEKIAQKVRVSSRGMISFPLLGEVEATGLTVSEFQDKLTQLLEKDYLVNPQVTVFIEEYSSVSIVGEVKRPGSYPIKGRLTILELISLAEGFSKIAAPNNVKILRSQPDGSKQEIMVKVFDLMKKGNDQENIVLRAGDVVVVPESMF